MFVTATGARQLMLGQFFVQPRYSANQPLVDCVHRAGWSVQRLAHCRPYIRIRPGVPLRRRVANVTSPHCLVDLAPEQALEQQRNIIFERHELTLVGFALVEHLLKQLLDRMVRQVSRHGKHASDSTKPGDVLRRQSLMQTVAPKVKVVV